MFLLGGAERNLPCWIQRNPCSSSQPVQPATLRKTSIRVAISRNAQRLQYFLQRPSQTDQNPKFRSHSYIEPPTAHTASTRGRGPWSRSSREGKRQSITDRHRCRYIHVLTACTCAHAPSPGTVRRPFAWRGDDLPGKTFVLAASTTASARGCRQPLSTASATSKICYREIMCGGEGGDMRRTDTAPTATVALHFFHPNVKLRRLRGKKSGESVLTVRAFYRG